MPIIATCRCGKRYRVRDEVAGREVKCSACGMVFRIPSAAPAPVAPVAPTPPVAPPPIPVAPPPVRAAPTPLPADGWHGHPARAVGSAGETPVPPARPAIWPALRPLLAVGGLAAALTLIVLVVLAVRGGRRGEEEQRRETALAPPAADTGKEPAAGPASASEAQPAKGAAVVSTPGPKRSKTPSPGKKEAIEAGQVAETRGNGAVPSADQPDVPRIAATVRWQYSAGSSGLVPSPNRWETTLTLRNEDSRPWTVVPDLLFAEALEADALAGGVCPKERAGSRNANVSCSVRSAPEDTSGSASTMILFPQGGDQVALTFTSFAAHWRSEGAEQLWRATELRPGAQIDCTWEHLSATTFKPEVKQKAEYHLFHLGPLCYRADDPRGAAYVLVARSSHSDEKQAKWESQPPEFVRLTTATIRKEAADPTKSVAWREQWVVWLWDQPRPCEDANEVLLDVLQDASRHPASVRRTAARGLIERRHAPAAPVLLALVRNKEADRHLRSAVIDGIHAMLGPKAVKPVGTVAGDLQDVKEVREAAIRALAQMGDEGWKAVQELRDDPEVGKAAREVLKDRAAAKPPAG